MAMEIIQTLPNVHEDAVACIAYNRIKREVYTAAEGDRAIKAWDLKTGQILRSQIIHKGMVTAMRYASSASFLFSGSIDGTIGIWTDKGTLLQVVPTGWPVFSLAWNPKHFILVAGGNGVLHIFKVDMEEARKLRHARQGGVSAMHGMQPKAGALEGALAATMLKRVCPPLKGWPHPQKDAQLAAAARSGAPSTQAGPSGRESRASNDNLPSSALRHSRDGAGSGTGPIEERSMSVHEASEGSLTGAMGGLSWANRSRGAGKVGAKLGCREEDYFEVCHTDIIKCIIITDRGKIFTGGYDRCVCMYDYDKLDKPKEAFKKLKDSHLAGIISMAFDERSNVIITGSVDGSMRLWSMEGRCLDRFEGVSNQPVSVAWVHSTNQYWATARHKRLASFDPRSPANITEYVKEPNALDKHEVELLFVPHCTDLILAATKQRDVVVWQYNQHAATRMFTKHNDIVEGLLVTRARPSDWEINATSAALAPQQPAHQPSYLRARQQQRRSSSDSSDSSSSGCDSWQQRQQQEEEEERERQQQQGSDEREVVYSWSADGHVLLWELDIEQNCDVYRCVEDIPMHDSNVLCLTHCLRRHCLISGGEDATIVVHHIEGGGPQPLAPGESPLPTRLKEHAERVTGVVLLKDGLLVSVSADRSIRVWDIDTMKQVGVITDAHTSPIQCLELCDSRQELATCCMGSLVKVWSCLEAPSTPRLIATLDHTEPDEGSSDEAGSGPAGGAADVAAKRASNMQWLTRSDLDGLPGEEQEPALGLVAAAIRDCARDVPEVTQVRWVSFRDCWVTAADDEVFRLWNTSGERLSSFSFKGGSCCCLAVDETNKLLLAAMMDRNAYVYDLDDPMPLAKFSGHSDIIRSISYLSQLDCYISASWDKSLRLWPRPGATKGAAASDKGPAATLVARNRLQDAHAADADDVEGEDEEHASTSKKEGPRPRSGGDSLGAYAVAAFAAQGTFAQGSKRRGQRLAAHDRQSFADDEQKGSQDPIGSLGHKLSELGKKLLQEINEAHYVAGSGSHHGAMGNAQQRRLAVASSAKVSNKPAASRGLSEY